jgi:hypothetical protein
MGIDGIGKKPPAGNDALGGAGGVGPAQKTGASFEVPETRGVAGAANVDATSPLSRLRAGEIDVNQYVDLKVDEATQHLSAMAPSDLADIKALLREKLVSDPGLVDLVRHSSGQTPSMPTPTAEEE